MTSYNTIIAMAFAGALDLQMFAEPAVQTPDNGTYGVSGMNTTESEGLSVGMKKFYKTALLENARANLVFNQFGKKQPLAKGNGKTVEFRRYKSFDKALTPLVEGVIPSGHKMEASAITVSLKQYGDYVPISDILEFANVDPILAEAVKENGGQAGATLDTLTRDVVCAGTELYFASPISNPLMLGYGEDGDRIASKLIAKAGTILKKTNTPKINGEYIGIIHPSVAYDLRQDPGWLSAHEYAKPDEIFNGEIGKLHGFRFLETTEAKIEKVTMEVASTSTTTSVTVKGIWGENFSGKAVAAEAFSPAGVKVCDVTITGCTATGENTVLTVSTLGTTLSAGFTVVAKKAHYNCLFFGADAWGTVEANGMRLESIIKDKTQGGGPLNQFSTAGWKAMHAAVILYQDRMLNLLCSSSFCDTDEEN